jgi:hypothetical protein
MAEGLTGWRLHVGAIFPTPVPPRPIRERYEVVPEGIDSTVVTWMNAMIWSSMKRCKVTGPITGFCKLLATL